MQHQRADGVDMVGAVILCHREGCTGIVRRPGAKFCSRRCSFRHHDVIRRANHRKAVTAVGAKGLPPASSMGSWWLDTATFYAKAKERFPPDDPHENHQRVFVGGHNDAPRHERIRQSKRHQERA